MTPDWSYNTDIYYFLFGIAVVVAAQNPVLCLFWIGLHGLIELSSQGISRLEPHKDHAHQHRRKVL
jgi:hypothetical protein